MFSEGSVMTGKVVLIKASATTTPFRRQPVLRESGPGAATSTAPLPGRLKSCGGQATPGASEARFQHREHATDDGREDGIGRSGLRYRRHDDRA